MKNELLSRATGLFAGLFIVGGVLCLPLYHWKIRAFLASRLWVKVVWWIPIFAVFLVSLLGGLGVCALVAALVIAQSAREYWPHRRASLLPLGYLIVVCAGLAHLPLYFALIPSRAVQALVVVCFASALSDVAAFFFGSFSGRHKLPAWINPGKSWEGVTGQIVGSFAGLLLVRLATGIGLGWWLALGIGLASAAGDIANSITKRRLGVKDWGQAIPGHGGFLDRFASLSMALAVGFWLTWLMK